MRGRIHWLLEKAGAQMAVGAFRIRIGGFLEPS
jgi:hypothetical protein